MADDGGSRSVAIEAVKVAGTVLVAAVTGYFGYLKGKGDTPAPPVTSPGTSAALVAPGAPPATMAELSAENATLRQEVNGMIESVNVVSIDGQVASLDDCKARMRKALLGAGLSYAGTTKNAVFVYEGEVKAWAWCGDDLKQLYLGAVGPDAAKSDALATRVQSLVTAALAT